MAEHEAGCVDPEDLCSSEVHRLTPLAHPELDLQDTSVEDSLRCSLKHDAVPLFQVDLYTAVHNIKTTLAHTASTTFHTALVQLWNQKWSSKTMKS